MFDPMSFFFDYFSLIPHKEINYAAANSSFIIETVGYYISFEIMMTSYILSLY